MAGVTGLGGVFLRAKDPKALTAWYSEHLGIKTTPWGGIEFVWDECPQPDGDGKTVFTFFKQDSTHFEVTQPAMINFRVDDMDALIAQLEAAGVKIDPKRDDSEFGKFAWIYDLEGNRVELWQPVPEAAA
jgi:predicted enzyme related to lactoylglutathione lyase